MTFEIRKGIAKPATKRAFGAGRAPKYPFADMEVGDSFIISDVADVKAKRRAASAINSAHKRMPGKSFSQRTDEQGRLGIWRDAYKQLQVTL